MVCGGRLERKWIVAMDTRLTDPLLMAGPVQPKVCTQLVPLEDWVGFVLGPRVLRV